MQHWWYVAWGYMSIHSHHGGSYPGGTPGNDCIRNCNTPWHKVIPSGPSIGYSTVVHQQRRIWEVFCKHMQTLILPHGERTCPWLLPRSNQYHHGRLQEEWPAGPDFLLSHGPQGGDLKLVPWGFYWLCDIGCNMSVVESTGVGRICIDTVKGVVPESTGNLQRHVLFPAIEVSLHAAHRTRSWIGVLSGGGRPKGVICTNTLPRGWGTYAGTESYPNPYQLCRFSTSGSESVHLK